MHLQLSISREEFLKGDSWQISRGYAQVILMASVYNRRASSGFGGVATWITGSLTNIWGPKMKFLKFALAIALLPLLAACAAVLYRVRCSGSPRGGAPRGIKLK